MELIYLRRRCRVIWTGTPFASLEGFSIQIATALNAGAGGSPVLSPSSQWMYDDQDPDLAIGYGTVGIVEHSKGNIWAGAGPITTKGHDGRDYQVWFLSDKNRMLAEEETINILAEWHVTAVV